MIRHFCPVNLQATQKLTSAGSWLAACEPGSWFLNRVKHGYDGPACSFQKLIIICHQEAGCS